MRGPTARWLVAVGLVLATVACGIGAASDGPDTQEDDLRRCRRLGTGCIDAGAVSSGSDASAPAADAESPPPDASAAAPDAGAAAPDASAANPDAGTISPADCATAPLRTTGPIYYYCDCGAGAAPGCISGDDANPGTDPSLPRRSLAGNPGSAFDRFRSLPAGGTVALCRGGAWSGVAQQADLNNSNCTTSATCDFRDYVDARWATPATERPRIVSSGATDLFLITDGGNYRIWNIDASQPSGTVGGTVFQATGGAHDIQFCNVRASGWIGFRFYAQAPNYAAGMEVRHSRVDHCPNFGLFGNAKGMIVDSNYFYDNGTPADTSSHTIYIGGINTSNNVTDFVREDYVFTNNEIYFDENHLGAVWVIHGGGYVDGLLIENNFLHGNRIQGYGIMFSGGNNITDGTRNLIMRRNRITSTSEGISVSMCQDCLIEDNIVAVDYVSPYNSPTALSIANFSGGDSTDLLAANITARNNTLYNGILVVGNNWDASANSRGLVLTNNALWNAQDALACIRIDGGLVAANAGNWCHNATTNAGYAASEVFLAPPSSLTDPEGANADFRPAPGSPLLGAGVSTDSLYWSPFAIGAARWSPSDPGVDRTGANAVTAGAAVN